MRGNISKKKKRQKRDKKTKIEKVVAAERPS